MRVHSKIATAFIALVVALPLAFGQNATSGPASAPSQSSDTQIAQQPIHRHMDRRGLHGLERSRHSHHHCNWKAMHRHHRGQREFMLARLVRNPAFRARIGVTAEQAQKIHAQTLNFRETQIRNRANLKVKHLELKSLLASDNPDRNAINGKLQEIGTARLAQEKSAIDFRLDMRAALTPDQRQKLQQMRKDFFQHRGFGHNGPGGSRGAMHSPNTQG